MDDVRRMVAEHECARLMSRYAHHLDHGEAEEFASLWAPDGVYQPAAADEPMVGREAVLAWARAYPSTRMVRHLVTTSVVDVLDEDRATGRSYSVVFREPDPRDDAVSGRVVPRSVVEYEDVFRRTEEGWRFASRVYTVDFMDPDEPVRPLPRARRATGA